MVGHARDRSRYGGGKPRPDRLAGFAGRSALLPSPAGGTVTRIGPADMSLSRELAGADDPFGVVRSAAGFGCLGRTAWLSRLRCAEASQARGSGQG